MSRPAPMSLSSRPRVLVVAGSAVVVDELLRLAAVAGVAVDVVSDLGAAASAWSAAPLVVVADGVARMPRPPGATRLPRREAVLLLGDDVDDAGVWVRAVEVGAEQVIFLPDAETWLVRRLAEAAEPSGPLAAVVAVVGGRGGAGATVLACALAGTAARTGRRALLLDADPLGGGVDLVVGAEDEPGARWPDLAASRGRLPPAALVEALPRADGVSVLSWDRGEPTRLDPAVVLAVLAAGRAAHDVVVADLPRRLDDAARAVLDQATRTLLVVPAEVRAAAAASRVAAELGAGCRDLQLVVRGPGPGGLQARQVAQVLGLPLAADLSDEPGLPRALDRGEPPARRGRGPLWRLCTALLDDVAVPVRAAA